MKRIYEYLTVLLFGFIAGVFAWEQTQKANTVTNIENTTKIKKNLAPVNFDEEIKAMSEPQIKKERKKWLKNVFKHKKK